MKTDYAYEKRETSRSLGKISLYLLNNFSAIPKLQLFIKPFRGIFWPLKWKSVNIEIMLG